MLQSIKARLIVFGLSISLIPIAVITTIYCLNARNTLKRHTLDWLTVVTETKKMHVEEFLEGKKIRVKDFSSDGLIRNSLERIEKNEPDADQIAKDLNRHLLVNKLPIARCLVAIAALDTEGKVIACTKGTLMGNDMSGQAFFTQGRKDIFVDQRRYIPELEIDVIPLSAPLTSKESGEPIGVLVNFIELGALSSITANTGGLGRTGEIYLVSKDKVMLTESRFLRDAPLREIVDTEPVRRGVMDQEMTGVYANYSGVRVVGASKVLPEYGWTLLAEIDASEAFAPLRLLSIIAAVLGGIAIGAVTGTGIAFALSVARPIKKLTEAANRFRAGELEYSVKMDRKDEIGVLASSFNDMAKELNELTRDLERRVAERTAESEARAKELARSNGELQQFAYVASHDLQEPLRMVRGYTQLLAHRYKDQLGEEANEFVDYIVDGASRMQMLINDLLSYSQVGTQGKPLEPTDCNGVLEKVLFNLQAAVKESGAVIMHEPLPIVLADSPQLVQVFQNLISNAIKFRKQEEVPNIHIAGRRKDNEWVFAVKDNGIGIDPKHFDRLFRIFQRLHNRSEYPGTGIGLAICKKVVERHGGRIWVESEEGKGSTFYFTIPCFLEVSAS